MQQGHGAPSKLKPKLDKSGKSNVATKVTKLPKDIVVTHDDLCIKVNSSHKTPRDPYDMSCPESSSDAIHVGGRSSCLWYTVKTHDINRYPADIVEAVCHQCKSCNHKLAQKGSTCEPIYFQIPVLVRCNFANKKSKKFYTPARQQIAVGCTCALTTAL